MFCRQDITSICVKCLPSHKGHQWYSLPHTLVTPLTHPLTLVCSDLIADAAVAARERVALRVADLERVSREQQRVNQQVDAAHASLTGASLMDAAKPGQQQQQQSALAG